VDATREETERPIKDACTQGRSEEAATLALDLYGREVLGFLIARVGEQAGHDVFSDLLEDFWRGLPAFEWRSSLRSWLYTLARHAISRNARSARRRRDVPFQTSGAFSEVVQRVRSETAAYLRTPMKSRFRELRARLSEDEQTLLILRIDRNLSWRELAAVMADQEDGSQHDDLDKLAARMRQRFQTAKDRLRQLAEAEGLLPTAEEEG
jgi:RNA polymerase sigma-70 factor (ECF subfamily)